MKVVIVGGGAGGISTASNIRKLDKDIEITVLTRDDKVAYSPCAIPYVIGGHIDSFDDIIMHKPEEYMRKNIRILTETEVVEINNDITELTYQDKKGNKQNLKYRQLPLVCSE